MGYIGIELIFNYLIHIFFIYSCVSLTKESVKVYILWLLAFGFLITFIFAFRILEFLILIPLSFYLYIFIRLFNQIRADIKVNLDFKILSIIGFFVSILWGTLDIVYF